MQNKFFSSIVLVMLVSVGALPLAQAQEHDQGRDQGHGHDQGRGQDKHEDDHRAQEQHGDGFGPQQAFHRGDRLPPQYRDRQYVVDNWREHRLSAPPRGYHWVQNGPDYALVAVSTGLILQLLSGH